jgi:hypothetical protein
MRIFEKKFTFDGQKEVKDLTKKMGRPTDNPKPHKLSVRLDDAGLKILDEYCAKKQVTRMEAIRHGGYRLKDEK